MYVGIADQVLLLGSVAELYGFPTVDPGIGVCAIGWCIAVDNAFVSVPKLGNCADDRSSDTFLRSLCCAFIDVVDSSLLLLLLALPDDNKLIRSALIFLYKNLDSEPFTN